MSTTRSFPSYVTCVAEILSSSPEPLDIQTLIERVQERRPVGKAVKTAVYNALRQLFQAVPVAPGRYGWLSSLLQGQWFRHHLTSQEIQRGLLFLDELEHMVFFPEFFQNYEDTGRTLTVELMGGPTLQVRATVEQDIWALNLGPEFGAWVEELGGRAQDDLLVWVADARSGRYGFRLQPRESRQDKVIADRNRVLVRVAEEIVAMDRRQRHGVPSWELAAALIAKGVYAHPVPPDDLHVVLEKESRLTLLDDMHYVLAPAGTSGRSSISSKAVPMLPTSGARQGFFVDFDSDLDVDILGADFFDRDSLESDGFLDWFEEDMEERTSDTCVSYELYLTEFYSRTPEEDPLSHQDFHLLEAELESLISLEEEFGYLLPEQEARKKDLAERLFIDPNLFYGNQDWGDMSDFEDPFGGPEIF